jgi:hypothetical protein
MDEELLWTSCIRSFTGFSGNDAKRLLHLLTTCLAITSCSIHNQESNTKYL